MFGIIHVAVCCCATVARCLRKANAKSELRATSPSDYAMTCKCHVTIADAPSSAKVLMAAVRTHSYS